MGVNRVTFKLISYIYMYSRRSMVVKIAFLLVGSHDPTTFVTLAIQILPKTRENEYAVGSTG